MSFRAERLKSPTGADLAVYRHSATGPARGILLISHGLAEHARRYEEFAAAMAATGLHVTAHDHRGHGATTGPDTLAGRFAPRNGVPLVLADLAAVRDDAVSRHPGLPVILFGHSMGGLIALNAAEDHPGRYDAVAVWNANFNPGLAGRAAQGILKAEKMLKGSDVPSHLLSRLTFGEWGRSIPGHRTPFDWLSRDDASVDAYIADPLCGFDATVSLWIDLFRLSYDGVDPRRMARLDRDLPVHLVGGGEDPATGGGREIRWLGDRLKASGLRDVTVTVYPGARHETLNDTIREVAMADFAGWCRRVTEGRAAT